ncbi:tripartite motif-containing protein 16 [Sarotherodon galilaeus]
MNFTYSPPAATARPLASTEDVPSEPPDEELPGPLEPSPRKKRCSRRRRGTPQPDVGTWKAINLSETGFSGHIVPSSLSPQSHIRSVKLPAVQSAAQLPAVQSAAQLPAVQSAAQLPAVQSATPPPITPPLQSSPLPVAQLPLVQQPTHSFIQSPSSPSHYKQGTQFIKTSAGSLKLAISETVAPSRASPEAGCQSPANSGPLEVKTPAPAAHPENSPEQSRLSAPPESSSEFTRLPPSSAECIREHFQPSEDCILLLLPESSHCAAQPQPVSTLPEVSVPAASVSVSTGGPEEPIQSQATLAGGSGEPSQHPASSDGGPEEPVQPQAKSAGGPESPVQPQAKSAGGSKEPTQHHASSAGGPGGPSSAAVPSSTPATSASSTPAASASVSSSTSGPASSASSTSGPASSASSTSGPASSASASSGPAMSGPAVATPSSVPAHPVPPRLCRPLSRPLVGRHGHRGRPPERVRRHRWLRGRPPDLLNGRHCLPSGWPPDWFCLHCRRCP